MILSSGLAHVRFVVVDPITRKPVPGYVSVLRDSRSTLMATSLFRAGETPVLDTASGDIEPQSKELDAAVITIPLGASVVLSQDPQIPTKEITIRVTASRLAPKAPVSTSATTRDKDDIKKFVNTTQADTRQLTKGQAGVAEDSAGQQHVRGEHTAVTYVVDGVPLPDTLSGRQGAVVVPSTIESLEIITGGFAPEFGGQTAAILNVTTLPSVKVAQNDLTLQAGNYDTFNGDLTAVGPIGRRANYVLNLNATRTKNAQEPPQPDNQTAHNAGSSRNAFAKVRFNPNSRDAFTLTLSNNPDSLEVANRTGLPASFAQVGQGYGLFGLRNADGTRPDVTPENAGSLGSETLPLPSQQAAGQDINQREITEFATLNFQRRMSSRDSAQVALTVLHSGQDVSNRNPQVDLANLPVDNSIEFNPEANRTIRHVQLSGSYSARRGEHRMKFGFLLDSQRGNESYRIEPASQLALDALAAIAPDLAPPGTASGELDVNGNPVYTATGPTPTLKVDRTGTYKAAYVQDTWQFGRLMSNYGVRADWYNQNQNLGQPDVSEFELSPRLNFQYRLTKATDVRGSYNKLFNTPPLAQGAILGAAVRPEIVDQYDLAVSHKLSRSLARPLPY